MSVTVHVTMNLTTHVILWCVTSWCRGVRHAHLFTLLQCTIKMSMPGLCKHAFHHQTCVPSSNTHFIIKHAFYHQACSPSSSMHSIGKHVLHHQTCISSLPRLRAERETDRENYDAWASQQVWSYIGWPLSASMYDQTRQLAQALYFSLSLSLSWPWGETHVWWWNACLMMERMFDDGMHVCRDQADPFWLCTAAVWKDVHV